MKSIRFCPIFCLPIQIFYHLGLAWGLRWADYEYSTFFNGNPKVLSDHVIPTMDQVITQSEWAFFVYNIYVVQLFFVYSYLKSDWVHSQFRVHF